MRTYLHRDAWPRPRATADLDVFLPTEVIVDHAHMSRVREVLDELGYQPVEDAKFLHFERQGATGPIRIEMLTGPIADEIARQVQIKGPRVRPRKAIELHTYLTKEAIDVELDPVEVKLHAFRDRIRREHVEDDRQFGRHHALDVYRVIGASRIVEEYFGSPTSLGVLRLREHSLAGDHLQIQRFVDLLVELFARRGS